MVKSRQFSTTSTQWAAALPTPIKHFIYFLTAVTVYHAVVAVWEIRQVQMITFHTGMYLFTFLSFNGDTNQVSENWYYLKHDTFCKKTRTGKVLLGPASIRVNILKPIYHSQHCIYEHFKMHTNQYWLAEPSIY